MTRSARGVGAVVLWALSVLAACDSKDARIGSMNPAAGKVGGSSGTGSIAAGAAGEETSVGGTALVGSGDKAGAGNAGAAGLGASGSGTATGGGGSGGDAGATAGGGGNAGAGNAAGQAGGGAGVSGGSGGANGTGGAAGQAGGGSPPSGLSLLAGGLGGPGNVDGTGAAARFTSPSGVASDGAGNLFVADTENDTIRKIDIATGAVTTLAGAPGQYGSVDGTGAAARFQSPVGIATDGAGNLYIADNGNSSIRKLVVASGVVTTLVGTAGHFHNPSGVVSDGTGNLYVADTGNHTICKVVIATGAVSTLAGTAGQRGMTDGRGAAARFDSPGGIVSDGAGNLYVADIDNYTIRKIVVATGAVSTFAGAAGEIGSADGTGTGARFSFPTGIVGDGAGNLYVTDDSNDTIRKIVIATAEVTTLAGAVGQEGSTDGTGAEARFKLPWGIAGDGAGNLYVVDTNNDAIRRVVIGTAAVTTVAGAARHGGSADGTRADARFQLPRGMASDGAGNLYVVDGGSNTIRKVAIATGIVTTLAGAAGVTGSADGIGAAANFSAPVGIAGDSAGNLYVVDGGNSTIRKVDIATGTVTTFAGAAGVWGDSDGPGVDARFYTPTGIASDAGGNLYVVDSTAIRRIVMATGDVTTVTAVPGRSAEDAGPPDIVSDGAGSLYIADGGIVQKVDIATGTTSTLAGSSGEFGTADGTGAAARFNGPKGLAGDGAGNLYVADGNTIRKIVIATATVSTVLGTPGGVGASLGPLPASLNSPYGIVVLSADELAIIDNVENAVLLGYL